MSSPETVECWCHTTVASGYCKQGLCPARDHSCRSVKKCHTSEIRCWQTDAKGIHGREDETMYKIGEKPGMGKYCCLNCEWLATLDNTSDRLPPCGNCGKGQNTTYYRCG